MNQNTYHHLSSAVSGVGFGIGALFVAAITAAGITFAAAAGVLAATPVGILTVAVAAGAITVAVAAATTAHCFRRMDDVSFKPISAFIGGLATIAASIGLIFAAEPRAFKYIMRDTPQTKAPTEDTRRVSFLDHKHGFNTAAQNSKKTLALTAKDFSSAPDTVQKLMTV